MMTRTNKPPLTEREMQLQPMPGEVELGDARRMAIHFAAVAKLRQEAALRKHVDEKISPRK